LTNGQWETKFRDIEPGFHQMSWVYARYTNLQIEDPMDDLAAEIEFIEIRGT
jgi:hypothetical protein